MARRPVKKRKPRKLSNTSAFQKVKELVERNYASEPLPDPFEIGPPKGKAYQWASLHPDSKTEFESYKRSGWKPVPASRHREFPSDRGRIVLGESVLLEVSRKKYEKMIGSGIARAKAQMQDQSDALRLIDGGGTIRRVAIMPDDWVASDSYVPEHDEPFIDIPISITIRVTNRWQQAAGACRLTTEEYMRRRIIMFSQGQIPGLLLPVANGNGERWVQIPFEIVENPNLIVRRDK